MTMSVWMQMHNVSYLTLGGFDEQGALNNVTGNPDFKFINTSSNSSWEIPMQSVFAFGNESEISSDWPEPRNLVFDMSRIKIWMPMDDFDKVAAAVNRMTNESVCVQGLGQCFSDKNCTYLRSKIIPGFLNITLSDGGINNSVSIHVNESQVFWENPFNKNNCIMQIKGYGGLTPGNVSANTWIVGKTMLSDYYTIFDASSLDSGSSTNLQVGIGKKNPVDLIGAVEIEEKEKEEQQQKNFALVIFLVILIVILLIMTLGYQKCFKKAQQDENRKVQSFSSQQKLNQRISNIQRHNQAINDEDPEEESAHKYSNQRHSDF